MKDEMKLAEFDLCSILVVLRDVDEVEVCGILALTR